MSPEKPATTPQDANRTTLSEQTAENSPQKKSLLETLGVKVRDVTTLEELPEHPRLEDLKTEMRERARHLEKYQHLFQAISEAALNEQAERHAKEQARQRKISKEQDAESKPKLSSKTRAYIFAFSTLLGSLVPPQEAADATVSGALTKVEKLMESTLDATERKNIGTLSPTLLRESAERIAQQSTHDIAHIALTSATLHFLQIDGTLQGEDSYLNLQTILEVDLKRSAREIARKRILADLSSDSQKFESDPHIKALLDSRIESEWRYTYERLGYETHVRRFALLELTPSKSDTPSVENDAVTIDDVHTEVENSIATVLNELRSSNGLFWITFQRETNIDAESLSSIRTAIEGIQAQQLVQSMIENVIPDQSTQEAEQIVSLLLKYGGWKFIFSLPPMSDALRPSSSRLLFTAPENWDEITPSTYTGKRGDMLTLVREHIHTLIRAQKAVFSKSPINTPTLAPPDPRVYDPSKRQHQVPKEPLTLPDGSPMPDYRKIASDGSGE